ncbi:MAG TPA: alpha/beta fold hydrolase [Solirubrobacterales bacterium]
MTASVDQVIEQHRAAGREFEAGGVRSFVREQGAGPAVLLLHGVPASSFLYRKVIPPLAEAGLRAIAVDFPGLGLAERPQGFDYSWSGLADWLEEAVDALGIERCHLVVHDLGGPIGCTWAVRNPDRVLSLTALNTVLDIAGFRPVWTMYAFSVRGLGEVALRGPRFVFTQLFYRQGIKDRSAVAAAEVNAYHALLLRDDGGAAFLRIMRSFESAEAQQRFLWEGLAKRDYPAQVVWGRDDPALRLNRMEAVKRALKLDHATLLPAKHFLQEDQAPAVAAAVAGLAGQSDG